MTHKPAKSCSEVGPANNEVDETVALQKFCGLKPWRQILVGRFSDNPRPGEPDQGSGFSDIQIAKHRKRRRDSPRGRIGEN